MTTIDENAVQFPDDEQDPWFVAITADLQLLSDTIASLGAVTSVGNDPLFTTKGDLPVAVGPASVARLGVGTNGQVITADSAQLAGMKWATPAAGVAASLLADTAWATKGDIAVGTANDTAAVLPVGEDGQVPVADPGTSTGIAWADAATPSATVESGETYGVADDPGDPDDDRTFSLGTHQHGTPAAFDVSAGYALGKLRVGTGSGTTALLAVGGNGLVLTADNGEATGTKWAAPPGGAGGVAVDGIWGAKGDIAGATGSDTADRLSVGTQGSVLTAAPGATTGLGWASAFASADAASGTTLQNMQRAQVSNADALSLVLTQMVLVAIALPIGFVVSEVQFWGGTPTMASPTHAWGALYNSSLARLGQSVDDTAATWVTGTRKGFTLASPVTTAYSGIHYAGLLIGAGTLPKLSGFTAIATGPGAALPVPCFLSTSGLTATAPDPAAAATTPNTKGARPWVGVA